MIFMDLEKYFLKNGSQQQLKIIYCVFFPYQDCKDKQNKIIVILLKYDTVEGAEYYDCIKYI